MRRLVELPDRRRQKIRPRTRNRVINAALLKETVRLMTRIPIQKLGLERTVPEFCKRMGWPEGERVNGVCQGHAFVAAVLACYASGAVDQRLGVPGFMRLHGTWGTIVLQYGELPTVAEMVESLSPDEVGPIGHPRRLDSLLGIEAKRQTFTTAPRGTRTPRGMVQ